MQSVPRKCLCDKCQGLAAEFTDALCQVSLFPDQHIINMLLHDQTEFHKQNK